MPERSDPLYPYLAKIGRRMTLSAQAKAAFLATPFKSERYETYRQIVGEGDRSDHCWLITDGLVSRFKSLRNGGRQIVSFYVPGDVVNLPACLVRTADHTIRTHTPTTALRLAARDLLKLAEDFPELGRAFWLDTLVDAAVFAEWMVNVGRRGARERVGHLLLELAYRLNSAGIGDGTTFVLPVTQTDLADATGLSPVHVNRTLKALRTDGLIRMAGRTIMIDEPAALALESEFSDRYLHPEGTRTPDDGR